MKSNRGAAILPVIGALFAVLIVAGVIVPGPKGKGAVWYAPKTWFSHKPADKADKAAAAVDNAQGRVDAESAKIIHQATVEANKTTIGARTLPQSQNASVVQRTAGNTFGLLNQISPLTAAEMQENETLILGLLSTETAKREAAEAAQLEAEHKAAGLSRDLDAARAGLAAAEQKNARMQSELRAAFEDRNAKANELEAIRARNWILIGTAALLLAGLVYLRFAMGGVGKALHFMEPALGPDKFDAVVSQLDSELGRLGQWFVRSGKAAAANQSAKAKSLLSGAVAPQKPDTTGATTP